MVRIARHDLIEVEHSHYLLTRDVFVAALYIWYRNLDVFSRKLTIRSMSNVSEFTWAMEQGREQYIHVATLPGEHHCFTLARAVLALETIMRVRTI